jgi:transposase
VAQKLILPLTAHELMALGKVARTHHFPDYRFKARGIIAINAELKVEAIAKVLGVSRRTVYNWAKWWREDGFDGLFDGHKGGRPVKLTDELIDCALEIARNKELTLADIKLRMLVLHPQASDFSLDRLACRLKEHRLNLKRCRVPLKKKIAGQIS